MQNVWKPLQNCCMWFEFAKIAPKTIGQTFFWKSCFLGKLGEIWASLGEIGQKLCLKCLDLKKCTQHEMKCSRFFGHHVFGVFSGKFGKMSKNPSHRLKFACSYTYVREHLNKKNSCRLLLSYNMNMLLCNNMFFYNIISYKNKGRFSLGGFVRKTARESCLFKVCVRAATAHCEQGRP